MNFANQCPTAVYGCADDGAHMDQERRSRCGVVPGETQEKAEEKSKEKACMRMDLELAVMAIAGAVAASSPAHAWTGASGMPEARWCIVHNPGLGNIQWDCRYRTLRICGAVVNWRSDMCLENPNWNLPGYERWR